MRKLFLSLAAVAATLTGAALMPSSASAAVTTPSAMHPAIVDSNVVDNVRWVRRCHHHWRTSVRHCRSVWVPGRRWHYRYHSRRWR
jgi:hypothetical protein